MEPVKQTGLIIEYPNPTSYIAGKETPIKGVVNPSGDWSDKLPDPENQFAPGFDTLSCTTFSAGNCIEMNLQMLPDSVKAKLRALGFDEKFNVSKRFNAIVSGTTKQGNTFEKVAASFAKIGFIPEQDLPFGGNTWEEYHNPNVVTQAMRDKAASVLKIIDVLYDWVFFDSNPEFTDDQYLSASEALKSAPVQIGIQTPATHAITLVKLTKSGAVPFYKVFDHYPNYVFESDGYRPHFGMRYSVIEKMTVVSEYPTYTFTKYLTKGLRDNAEVRMMQRVLIIEKCLKSGLDTGNFFDQTERAVKTFQAKYGIQTTGTVGPVTRNKLNQICQKKNLDVKDYGLYPKVARMCNEFIVACANKGFNIKVTQGFRTYEEQTKLYEQGRTRPGAIVTNARAGESFHNHRVAFDVVFVKDGGGVTYNGNWDAIAKIGKSLGFEWGGDWQSFKDMPHFQFTGGYTLQDFINKKIDEKVFQ